MQSTYRGCYKLYLLRDRLHNRFRERTASTYDIGERAVACIFSRLFIQRRLEVDSISQQKIIFFKEKGKIIKAAKKRE